jgi:hypothetical protein
MWVRARTDRATHVLVQLIRAALSKPFKAPATIRNGGCKNRQNVVLSETELSRPHITVGCCGEASRRGASASTPPLSPPPSAMAGAHVPFSQQTHSSDQQNTQKHRLHSCTTVQCPTELNYSSSQKNPAALSHLCLLQETGWDCRCGTDDPLNPIISPGFNHVQYCILGSKAAQFRYSPIFRRKIPLPSSG